MTRSRTVKTLAALVMAMTVGTFALMLLELKADPLKAHGNLAAEANSPEVMNDVVLKGTAVPVQPMSWRIIILHSSPDADTPVARGCHFIVHVPSDNVLTVEATSWWKDQSFGRHAYAPGYDYNRQSIGICLVGDFSSQPPSGEQLDATVSLVKALREHCAISPANVYLARQLPLRDKTPGESFPAERFDKLITQRP